MVRDQGYRVALIDQFLPHPIGQRTLNDVWQRQARWASLRRASFPRVYASEILSFPWLAVMLAAYAFDDALEQIGAGLAMLGAWYSTEAICSRLLGWPERTVHRLIRDVMLPVAWVKCWIRREFNWHGHEMRTEKAPAVPRAP
jgi:ceramide glucosyltransferase